jgi:hypothetical protein
MSEARAGLASDLRPYGSMDMRITVGRMSAAAMGTATRCLRGRARERNLLFGPVLLSSGLDHHAVKVRMGQG